MSEHQAVNGEISGSLSTGPRYSVDELNKGESIYLEESDFTATIVDAREEDGEVIVVYEFPDRAGTKEVTSDKIRKLDNG